MHKPNQSRKGKGTLFPHINEAAVSFGCSRTTLYRVLKKQLPDHHSYAERYRIFTKGIARAA